MTKKEAIALSIMNKADPTYNNTGARLIKCIHQAIPPAIKTALFLLKIMIPVSLGMTLLKFTGLLEIAAHFAAPAFMLVGLPGEAALVFITSIFLNIYSAIAVISTLSFTARELTILALMCLISHNFLVETPVQKKTGSSAVKITAVRLFHSFAGAVILNFLLPQSSAAAAAASAVVPEETLAAALEVWFFDSLLLIIQILILITTLLFMQKILEEFGIIKWLTSVFRPLMKVMGLPDSVTFLWIVANVLGLAYGSAIMIEESEQGNLTREDADLLNHHIGISHSLLEDTLLFVAIGVSAPWIIFPRLFLAVIQVWAMKWRKHLFPGLIPESA